MFTEDTSLCCEKYLSISNNDSGLKKIANLYENIEDQVFDFEGKDFIYSEPLVPFVLQNCSNIVLKNFSIDFETPFFFQAQVIGLGDGYMDIKVLDECVYTIRGEKLYFRGKERSFKWHGRGSEPAASTKDMTWEQSFEWNMWFREDGSTPYEEASYYLLQSYTCKELEQGIIRLFNATDRQPEIGWHIVIKGKKEQNRRWPGIFLENCSNITIENVTVYNSSGMALIAQRCDTIKLDHYEVKLRDGSKRVCSSTADGSHFSGCKGDITMKDCYFENMLDDALNVHGIFVVFDKVLSNHEVLCRYGHSQQMGVPFADTGDVIRCYHADSFEMLGELVVDCVKAINSKYFSIRFEDSIDVDMIKEGVVFDNKTWQPQVYVNNCVVKNNRARTLLVQTEHEVIIENNEFVGPSMNCLQFSGDTNFWYESGFVNNVIVRNNVFKYVRDYIITAYIEVDSSIKYHSNIDIVNNKIYGKHSKIFNIYSVDGFRFCENELFLEGCELDGDSFKSDNCVNVVVKNNR